MSVECLCGRLRHRHTTAPSYEVFGDAVSERFEVGGVDEEHRFDCAPEVRRRHDAVATAAHEVAAAQVHPGDLARVLQRHDAVLEVGEEVGRAGLGVARREPLQPLRFGRLAVAGDEQIAFN